MDTASPSAQDEVMTSGGPADWRAGERRCRAEFPAQRLVRDRGGALVEINVDGEDTDARRFYEAHGFTNTEPNQTDPILYYYREL